MEANRTLRRNKTLTSILDRHHSADKNQHPRLQHEKQLTPHKIRCKAIDPQMEASIYKSMAGRLKGQVDALNEKI